MFDELNDRINQATDPFANSRAFTHVSSLLRVLYSAGMSWSCQLAVRRVIALSGAGISTVLADSSRWPFCSHLSDGEVNSSSPFPKATLLSCFPRETSVAFQSS